MRGAEVSNHDRRTLQSVLTASIAVSACVLALMPPTCAAQATPAPTVAALPSSQDIKQQVETFHRQEVTHQLAGLPVGAVNTAIAPRELQILVGRNVPTNAASPMEEIDIDVRSPPLEPERPLQSQIPVGFAGIAWGVRHPGQAWRLLLPVLS